uniref:Synaptic plasticity regulator PANTS n=1 Tax=Arion vulgaris TaxID=1028688 RepID=A0A0B6YZX2_9EUPU
MVESHPKDIWLVRPCEIYNEEYRDCKTLLSRFYQHYIYGRQSDCTAWRTDYDNCMKYRNSKDLQAAEAVIKSERQRRNVRLQNAKSNDVWEYRKSPPAEWFAPLNSEEDNKR